MANENRTVGGAGVQRVLLDDPGFLRDIVERTVQPWQPEPLQC